MTVAIIDRRGNTGSNLAFKVAVLIETTTNITLSGEQTVNSVPLVTGDRCLVKDQTDPTENGVYCVDTAAWTRATDFNDNTDVTRGVTVPVFNGNAWYELTTTGTISFGTSNITFAQVNITQTGTDAAQALANSETAIGIALIF